MEIDLRKFWLPLAADMERSLRAFSQMQHGIEVSTVGLFGDGFHGSALLFLDTHAHSGDFLRKWKDEGGSSEDAFGRFCSNCPDFEYGIGEFSFPGYPDLYELDEYESLFLFLSTEPPALSMQSSAMRESIFTCFHF